MDRTGGRIENGWPLRATAFLEKLRGACLAFGYCSHLDGAFFNAAPDGEAEPSSESIIEQ
jgi:hypothetical protein